MSLSSEPASASLRFEPVIGLEVHVQLKTASKLFCGCANLSGVAPNSLVCSVCLGYPGALPATNERAIELAATLALAIGCRVAPESIFARKNYFYPDLPKGYQISQFERPLAERGAVRLEVDGHPRIVRIRRVHVEEDAGKLLHDNPFPEIPDTVSLVEPRGCGRVRKARAQSLRTPRLNRGRRI